MISLRLTHWLFTGSWQPRHLGRSGATVEGARRSPWYQWLQHQPQVLPSKFHV